MIRAAGPSKVARLGVTVSSRVGNSVARNRVKRLVREVFRLRRGDVPGGTDFVVIAKPGAPELGFAAVWAEVTRALDLADIG